MADVSSVTIDSKNLYDLRVVDLKRELEKRGLSKSGSKRELVERLKTQLKIEELIEKSKTAPDGAQAPPIQLSEGGQNEFVKNYLQQREKLLEQKMEQKKKYQEEASRSQESESQSETDDSNVPQLTHTVQNYSEIKILENKDTYDEETDKQSDADEPKTKAAEDHPKLELQNKATEKIDDNEESGDIIPARMMDKRDVARARSNSPSRSRSSSASGSSRSSSASSQSRDRSRSGSRSELEPKHSKLAFEEATKPSLREVGRLRSPSKDRHSRSRSPEDLLDETKQPRAGKESRSRSVSSSGSDLPERGQGDRSSRPDNESQHSASDSSDSSPRRKELRSHSFSSNGSAYASPRKRQLSGEPCDSEQQNKKLKSSSSELDEGPQKKNERNSKISLGLTAASVLGRDDVRGGLPEKMYFSQFPDLAKDADDSKESSVEMKSGSSRVSRKTYTDKHCMKETEQDLFITPKDGIQDQVEVEEKHEQVSVTDQASLARSHFGNDKKAAEEIVIKPTRKRRWGSNAQRITTCQPAVNISTESLKVLIPEMQPHAMLAEILPELENTSAQSLILMEEEQDMDIEASNTIEEHDAVKNPNSSRNQDSAKLRNQEGSKLSRTIFQDVKPDEDNKDSDVEKSYEEVEPLQDPTNSDSLVESSDRKQFRDNRTVVEQEKKETLKETKRAGRLPFSLSVDEPQPVGKRSPSPAKNSATNIIHILHLVRPYTLGQLKELLSQTGTISEDGFWIDKIKSHCLVMYSSVDEAVITRRSLHGKRWPLSNPNVLRVEYSTQEEFDMFKNAKDGVIPRVEPIQSRNKPEEVQVRKQEKDQSNDLQRGRERKDSGKLATTRDGRRRANDKSPPVREWDRDKIRQSRSRSRDRTRREERLAERGTRGSGARNKDQERDRSREEKRKRRASSPERKEVKEKVEAEPPAKLLDDLFRKTKAVPCIYWLPLTEAQVAEKMALQLQMEEERKRRRIEREQQLEEREQKGRVKEDKVIKETRRPDRRDTKTTDVKPKDSDDAGKKSNVSGVRNDRTTTRR